MADGTTFSLGADAPTDDILHLIDVARRKHDRSADDAVPSSKLMMGAAVRLLARHVGPAEAAAVCAEIIALIRSEERRRRAGA